VPLVQFGGACYRSGTVDLSQSVVALELEASELEQRNVLREHEARAAAASEEAELTVLEAALAEEQARLDQFTAELRVPTSRPVLTVERGVLAALSMGAFCWGSLASGVDVTRVSVGLFAGVWVAFLIGALRGR
jgi:hypothetical protein